MHKRKQTHIIESTNRFYVVCMVSIGQEHKYANEFLLQSLSLEFNTKLWTYTKTKASTVSKYRNEQFSACF